MPRGAWLVLLLSGLVGVASPARAQWANGGVSVDPTNGSTSAPSGSSGNTVTFTVTNTGEELDNYSLECGRTGQVTACSVSTSWIELEPSGSTQVTVTFSAGGPGSGTVTLLASSLNLWANSPVEATGSYGVTVPFVYAVSVTALDGPDSLGYSASGQFTFEVRNTGNVSNTYTFLSTVTGPGSAGQITPGSAALGPGAATVVTAVLNAGNIPGQASIILTANGSGSATDNDALTVTVYGPSVFTLAYAPSDKLERSECLITGAGPSAGAQCGDLLYTHALPAYRTLNRARSVTLLYNSGLANPRSVVAVDYTQFAGQPVPEMLRLEIRRVSGGAILDVVYYGTGGITNDATRTFRLVMPSTQDTSQAEPIEVLAARKFGGAWGPPEVNPARLVVNGWQDSPFGAGWWIAGVERLLSVTGGQLVIRGDGSPLFFQQSGGAYLSPPGEYSVLTAVGSVYRRALPGNRIAVWYASTGYVDSIVELQPNRLVARYYWRPNANPGLSRFLDSIVDPVGRAIRFTYEGSGQLSQILIPGAQPVTLVGTMNGPNTRFRLESIADPDGYTHQFTYDADYRMLTSQGRATGPVRYTYDPASRLDSIILPAGASAMQHRSWQRLGAPGTGTSGQESNPAVPVPTGAGLLAQAAQLRNGVPEVANFTLDDHQRVAQYDLPASAFGTVTRNAAGHPTLITRNDAVWVQTWDAQGLLRRIVQVEHGPPTGPPNARDSAVTTIDYHPTWRAPTVVTSPTNAVTQFAYDAYGRRDSVTDPTGLVVALFYNNRGQPDSIKEAGQDTATVYTYSAATGNLTSVRDALMATTYLYDATWGSDVVRVEGSAGQVTTYTYDGIKRPDVVTQLGNGPDSTRVQNYDYNDLTRVTTLSTNHKTATWTRDAAGRVTEHCVALNACDTYNYWGDGINPSNVVLRGGKQVYFVFDAAGRMTERSYGGNPWNAETYQYDASGNLTQAVNAVSRVNRWYDPYGRLKSESQAIRKWADTTALHAVTAYHAYDRAGRRRVTWLDRTVTMVADSFLPCPEYCLWEQYPRLTATDSILYTYDQASNLNILLATLWKRTSSSPTAQYWDFNYDARHRLTQTYVPLRSGSHMLIGSHAYDNDGRLLEYRGLDGVLTAVDYDGAGRPLQVVVGGLSSTYEYNVLGELKARTGTIGDPEAYTYDAGGNRRTDLMTTYAYNNRDQLTGSNSTACGQATYNYDASGNLWRQTPAIYCSAVEYREMLYDGLNRLTWSQTEKSVPGGIQTETRDFWYDALGRRILAMTVDSGGEGEPPRDWGVWRYWWLDNHVAVKTHNHQALPDWNWPSVQRVSGTLSSMGTWYLYGPGVDNPLASWGYTSSGGGYSDTTQHLYFQDWRGSVTEVRGANGQNLGWGANDFTAYGAGGGGGDLGVAPGYNGLESNGGLVYMRNRWYDPNAGRFTQEDPIGYAGGINLYGYVGNNPVSYSDPFGLCWPPSECLQALANWGASQGGVVGGVALNVAAAGAAAYDVLGGGDAENAVSAAKDGRFVAAAASAFFALPGGRGAKAGSEVLQRAASELAERAGRNSVSIGLVDGVRRVDLVGRSHGGVPTPHVQNYRVHTNPETGASRLSKDGPVTPATAQDLREVRRVLEERE